MDSQPSFRTGGGLDVPGVEASPEFMMAVASSRPVSPREQIWRGSRVWLSSISIALGHDQG